jgi:hypothetical protein
LNILKAGDVPVLNADEDLFLQQRLIDTGIAGGCPAVPDTGNYESISP